MIVKKIYFADEEDDKHQLFLEEKALDMSLALSDIDVRLRYYRKYADLSKFETRGDLVDKIAEDIYGIIAEYKVDNLEEE